MLSAHSDRQVHAHAHITPICQTQNMLQTSAHSQNTTTHQCTHSPAVEGPGLDWRASESLARAQFFSPCSHLPPHP